MAALARLQPGTGQGALDLLRLHPLAADAAFTPDLAVLDGPLQSP